MSKSCEILVCSATRKEIDTNNPYSCVCKINKKSLSRKPYLAAVSKMSEEGSSKKSRCPLVRRHKKFTPTTLKSKITAVATKILLEDAHKGYKKGNDVCSFSLEMVLGMLAFGAKGRTLEQLLGFLGHETMDQLRAESCALKFFAQNCVGSLHVKANYVDFINPAKAVQVINSWVKRKTKGLIPTVIQEEDLLNWEDARMVFVNALHFNGTWSKPFNTNKTRKKEFHLIKGEKVSVPFMTSKKFDYGSFGDYKILKIPYESKGQSNEFSMYIFLPDRRDGLKDLLQVFHSNHAIFYGDFDLKTRKLDLLWVPKFKISYDFEALDVVKEMGLILPFNPTNKELTGIV
uniref:Serpin domain-containing protein n=1 Tax=Tanacetum cinerariifolium TaxID=118510 RepID=A0A6L2K308_TANCI|nr:hypothetical protein [Tanacetum cinerariifolium]